MSAFRGGAGNALVFVDDLNLLGLPAKLHGKIHERILTCRSGIAAVRLP